jgi:hypothetical protein
MFLSTIEYRSHTDQFGRYFLAQPLFGSVYEKTTDIHSLMGVQRVQGLGDPARSRECEAAHLGNAGAGPSPTSFSCGPEARI